MSEQPQEEAIKGYTGKVLHVDLSTGKIEIEEPSPEWYRRYVGGAGFISYYLLKEVPKGADPLGPENRLIFAPGPITGVPVPGSGRNAVGAKSPLTGGWGEADVGGFFGAELRRAGFDAVVIKGEAETPVYLWVHDGQAELRPADHLWGTNTFECQEKVREELGESRARLAMIGPAGEKLVRFACIINDVKHAAGRTGLGAVMGAKKLKAVVARGNTPVPVADPDKVRDMAKWYAANWREKHERMHDLGTPGGIMGLQESGKLPTRNFQDGQFEGAEKISGEALRDTLLVDRGGCFACPIRCKRVVKVEDDDYQVDPEFGGPEYETIGAFGSNCGVDDLRAISKANEYCNGLGLDTISCGMAISFAMECYENGILTDEDTGGLELRFGNGQAMAELTRQIAMREGLGDLLAEGPTRAAAKIGKGSEAFVLDVKKQPFPVHKCRTRHAQALGYAVSPTGADHMHNFWDEGLSKEPLAANLQALGLYTAVSPTVLNPDKVRAYTFGTNARWLANIQGLCMFLGYSRPQLIELMNAITGWDTNIWEMMKGAERMVTMARVFNMREGLGRQDDVLPPRVQQPHVSGTLNEVPVTPEALEAAVTDFYGMMGWDPETGAPTRATLEALDIAWVA